MGSGDGREEEEGGLIRAETVSGVGGRKYASPSHGSGGYGERRDGGGMRVRGVHLPLWFSGKMVEGEGR